jgi:hypothetical protein
MPPTPSFTEPQAPVKLAQEYDYRKTIVAALTKGGLAALSVIVADQMGLTSALYQHVPALATAPLATLLISGAFFALKNYLANRNR